MMIIDLLFSDDPSLQVSKDMLTVMNMKWLTAHGYYYLFIITLLFFYNLSQGFG